MALTTKAPRGTGDMLPQESYKYHYLENVFKTVAGAYNYKEIRTPVFEHTELFNRSVGETTDVVQKEMYTFNDNGGRSITLRPEGTAGVARALLEHGLYSEAMPQKMYYITSCYRYEKPQAGRLREFHQFGIECFGASDPIADAEVISVANSVFESLGIENISLEINSIGCPKCRAEYHRALKEYFSSKTDSLCETCKSRLERNPMRILDCKSPVCSEIASKAPVILDYLCDECKEHFDGVRKELDIMEIAYEINPRIVRGLDYYTRTVFEFVSSNIGAQGTVCGGGRYDGLIEQLGGNPLPALGFGMGIERLKLLMESTGVDFGEEDVCKLFVVAADKEASEIVTSLVQTIRSFGISAERDICGRSVKAQMKYANKIGAQYTVVIGKNEIDENSVILKNMQTGETEELELRALPVEFMAICYEEMMDEMMDGEDRIDSMYDCLDDEDDDMDIFEDEIKPPFAPKNNGLKVIPGGKDKKD